MAEETTDEELLEGWLRGREDSFTELVRRHEDRIFALALRMTGNRPDALDATQDTFLTAARRASTFRAESSFGTWLYRIGINACHDLLRKKKGWETLEADPAEAAPATAPARGIDEAIVLQVDLARALASLPPLYREAVVMHDLGDLPYDAIARLTGVGIGTVKSRISRGRRRLAELLEQPSTPDPSKDR
ncbi:MAG: sigma-70 family RNA polymerase sigma factor [Actinomycetota bacterium]|nr:sigma-70 family RNA polymerase sigma factor [Actinomycetota bacterium]